MVNLKSDPKPSKESTLCAPCYEEPAYPYGLQITLCDETLRKLSMTDLPKVGTVITFTAQATVTSISSYETADMNEPGEAGEHQERTVALQITDMDMAKPSASAADRMYGS